MNKTFKFGSQNKIELIIWMDIFMQRYKMSVEEFKKLPIPTFYALANIIVEEAKENQKKMKDGRRT